MSNIETTPSWIDDKVLGQDNQIGFLSREKYSGKPNVFVWDGDSSYRRYFYNCVMHEVELLFVAGGSS